MGEAFEGSKGVPALHGHDSRASLGRYPHGWAVSGNAERVGTTREQNSFPLRAAWNWKQNQGQVWNRYNKLEATILKDDIHYCRFA